jgi:hypothetical protein
MPTHNAISSVRTGHSSELTAGIVGTDNDGIDTSTAKVCVVNLPDDDVANGRYFITRAEGGLKEANAHEVLAFASTGAADTTFKCAVWGWQHMGTNGPWRPNKLLEVTGTGGTLTGIASHGELDDTWRFPDAIAINVNNCPDGLCEAFGGTSGDDGAVDLRYDAGTYPILEVELSINSSSSAVRCWRVKQ